MPYAGFTRLPGTAEQYSRVNPNGTYTIISRREYDRLRVSGETQPQRTIALSIGDEPRPFPRAEVEAIRRRPLEWETERFTTSTHMVFDVTEYVYTGQLAYILNRIANVDFGDYWFARAVIMDVESGEEQYVGIPTMDPGEIQMMIDGLVNIGTKKRRRGNSKTYQNWIFVSLEIVRVEQTPEFEQEEE